MKFELYYALFIFVNCLSKHLNKHNLFDTEEYYNNVFEFESSIYFARDS